MFEGSLFGSRGRSLPVYLLLDCSASMRGAPIQAVSEGVYALYTELLSDPEASSKVKISVITYADVAAQTDLVPIREFVPPQLSAGSTEPVSQARVRRPLWVNLFRSEKARSKPPCSRLDGALNLLFQSIEADVRLNTPMTKGDYRPLVFILTAGRATDGFGSPSTSYRSEVTKLRSLRYNQKPTLVALGCGPDVNMSVLQSITDNALLMHEVSSDTLRQFFRVISISVTGASRTSGTAAEDDLQPPPGFISFEP